MNHSIRFLALALAISPVALFAQGALTPAGAPAPTMKTLTQIEPRTAVQTLPGDATSHYVISSAGSYYLTGNIDGVAGKRGIKITAINVQLDLNGFAVRGVDGTLDAIMIGTNGGPVTIRDGFIQFWGGGGIVGADATHVNIQNVSITVTKGGPGIRLAGHSAVRNVTVSTSYGGGIDAGQGSTVEGSTVSAIYSLDTPEEDYTYGIRAGTVTACSVSSVIGAVNVSGVAGIEADVVENCTVTGLSAGGATNADGISASVIRGCRVTYIANAADQTSGILGATVQDNFVTDVTGGGAAGIRSNGYNSLISRNRVIRCSIVGTGNTYILENNISLNPGSGTGIVAQYSGNRIEGNQVNSGAVGISTAAANSFVARNTVFGSTTKYSFAAGTQAVVLVIGADDITTASPWANFSQ